MATAIAIGIRDTRNTNFFWCAKEIIQRDAKTLGKHGVFVYMILASYANHEDQTAFPSIKTMAEKTGVSQNFIRKGIKVLKELGWISVKPRYDEKTKKHQSHIYTLLDTPLLQTMKEPPAQNEVPPPSQNEGKQDLSFEQDLSNTPATPETAEKPEPPPKPRDTFFDAIVELSFGVTPGDKEREKIFGGRVGRIKRAIIKAEYCESDYRKAVADFKRGFPDGTVPRGEASVVSMIDDYKKASAPEKQHKLAGGMTHEEFDKIAKAVVEQNKTPTPEQEEAKAMFQELMGQQEQQDA